MIRSTISKLLSLRDVDQADLADGGVLVWNVSTQKFEPGEVGNPYSLSNFLGDGSDAAVVLDGTNTFSFASKSGSVYTLTRDLFATTLIVDTGVTLDTAHWRVFATEAITIDGTVQNENTATAASGFTAGSWAAGSRPFNRVGGGNGGATTTGVSGAGFGFGTKGGTGGAGGVLGATNGGVAGTKPTSIVNFESPSPTLNPAFLLYGILNSGSSYLAAGTGGGGGASVDASHRGGGGGYGGGVIMLSAPSIEHNGVIQARGGDGAASPSSTNGGGGGGGGGGAVYFNTTAAVTGSGTTTLTGGNGGSGVGTGNSGSSGATGTVINNVWS